MDYSNTQWKPSILKIIRKKKTPNTKDLGEKQNDKNLKTVRGEKLKRRE